MGDVFCGQWLDQCRGHLNIMDKYSSRGIEWERWIMLFKYFSAWFKIKEREDERKNNAIDEWGLKNLVQ